MCLEHVPPDSTYSNREIAVGVAIARGAHWDSPMRRRDAASHLRPHDARAGPIISCGAASTPQPPTIRSDYDLNQRDYFQNPACVLYTQPPRVRGCDGRRVAQRNERGERGAQLHSSQ